MNTCWKELIETAMADHGEVWEDIIASTFKDEEELVKFYDGYGGPAGISFTAWTETRVYFPVVYDGAEWAESVPRNPCDKVTGHVGGW